MRLKFLICCLALIVPAAFSEANKASEIYKNLSQSTQGYEQELQDRKSKNGKSKIKNAERELEILELRKIAAASRENAILSLEKFLKRHPSNKILGANALFILGQLNFEGEKNDYLNGFDADAQLDADADKAWFSKSKNNFEKLIRVYPNYPYLDAAYYTLGLISSYDGDDEEAEIYWRELLNIYPKSQFRDEVLFRVAEIAFANKKWEQAKSDYSIFMAEKNRNYLDKVVYKLAWIDYIRGDYNGAIAGFVSVLDMSSQQDDKRALLDTEAKEYLGICFFEKNKSKGKLAINDLNRFVKLHEDKPYFRDVYLYLGNTLANNLDFVAAARAYQGALEMNSSLPDSPELAYKNIQLYKEAGRKADRLVAEKYYIEHFSPDSEWVQVHQEISADVLKKSRQLLLNLALDEHEKGRESNKKEFFLNAAEAYREYLKYYPVEKNIAQINFYLGDALFDAGDFSDAGDAYQESYDLEEKAGSLLAILFSFESEIDRLTRAGDLEKVDWEVISHGKKDDNQARIPELYQKYIKRGQEFSEKYASEKEAPVMLFRAGVALAHFGHETESTNIFDKLILRFPKSKPALLAANDMLKSKVAAGAWREASRLSEKFKKANIGDQFQSFSKAQLASDFNIALSVFDAAEIERTKGSIEKANLLYEESANLYLKILSTDSKFEDGPKALFNAAQAYKLSGQLAKADQLFENLAKTFPKHKLAKTSKKENAIFAENNFRFARAAKAYQALIGNTPKLEKTEKQDLMLSIALMFELAQENKNSAQAFLDYANKYPTSKNSLQARFSAAKLFEKAGDAKSQRNTLNKIILIQPTADNAAILAEVALSLGKIELKNKAWRNARKRLKLATDMYAKYPTSQSAGFAAEAAFELANFNYNVFLNKKITGTKSSTQKKQLGEKSKLLGKLKTQYESIINTYKQAKWSMASLYRLGRLYESMFSNLLNAKCPNDIKSIDEFACDEYKNLLEDKAFIVEDKAVETFELLLLEAQGFRMDNIWTQASEKALMRLRPGKLKPNILPAEKLPRIKPVSLATAKGGV